LILLNTTNAQWYYRSCGVADLNNTTEEEFECLWNKAQRNVRSGTITTIIGTSIMCVGLIVVNASVPTEGELFAEGDAYGILILAVGIIINAIGIPILITGTNRRSKLRKSPFYEKLNLESMNLSPNIGIDQFTGTNYYGMSIS
jgi:hypothetical protein